LIVTQQAIEYIYEHGFGYDSIHSFDKFVKFADAEMKKGLSGISKCLRYVIYIDMHYWEDSGGSELSMFIQFLNWPQQKEYDDYSKFLYEEEGKVDDMALNVTQWFTTLLPEVSKYGISYYTDTYERSNYRYMLERCVKDKIDISEAYYYI